ncbi:MAG: hypothetical protein AAF552_11790 [Pseudomonadota bacterium]
MTESPSEFLDCALKAPVDYSAATAAAAFLVADPNFSVATETADDNQYLDLDEPARSEEAWRIIKKKNHCWIALKICLITTRH